MDNIKLFFPQNPKELDDWSKIEALLEDDNWGLQLKRDGVRGILQITPEGIRVYGRKAGKKDKTRPLEMTKNLPTVSGQVLPKFLHGWAFDCEIYHPDRTAAQVAGAVNPNRREEPVDWEPEIEFWIFDCPMAWGEENKLNQEQRLFMLDLVFAHFNRSIKGTYLRSQSLVNLFLVDTVKEGKSKELQTWLAHGEEGGVLKRLDATYMFSYDTEGKRSAKNWVKAKKSYDGDFVITGTYPAEKYYTGKNIETWQYWEIHSHHRKYYGDQENLLDKPLTKFYYYGWIGAIEYGLWMDREDFLKYSEANTNMRMVEERGSGKNYRVLAAIGTTSGFDEMLRVQISSNPDKYIGQVVKISGMEQFEDTLAVRHPSVDCIRWDKSPEECEI